MLNNIKNSITQKQELIFSENPLNISLKMLIIVLLLYMNDNTYLLIFMPVLLLPALFFRQILLNKYYWAALAMVAIISYLLFGLAAYIPNHKYIFAYAVIAVAIVLFLAEKEDTMNMLSYQGKIIIGLCFLFASVGKFLAPEFFNGTFFEFTNVTDRRFFGLTSVLNGLSLESLSLNLKNLNGLLNTNNTQNSFNLLTNANVTASSFFLPYWTIFIEGMIAITFCLPSKYKLSKYRNWFLIIFIFTTYPIATVKGFAIILCMLGFIQSIENNQITQYSKFYLLVFILLPLTDIPFSRFANLFL
jgi:hypothetical protein